MSVLGVNIIGCAILAVLLVFHSFSVAELSVSVWLVVAVAIVGAIKIVGSPSERGRANG